MNRIRYILTHRKTHPYMHIYKLSIQRKHPIHTTTTTTTTTKMPTPIHWILDWDSTITTHDTLTPLVHISASAPSRDPSQKHHISQEWTRVSNAYMHDLSRTLANHSEHLNDPAAAGLDREKEMLRVLEDVERRSLQRVADARIFAGLTRGDVQEGARRAVEEGRVRVRKGFGGFFGRWMGSCSASSREGGMGEDAAGLTILSVNWSRHFIASCLAAAQPPIKMPTERIISNELEGLVPSTYPHTGAITDDEPVTTGNIVSTYTHPTAPPLILSSRHKLAILESLLSSSAADNGADTRAAAPSRKKKSVIYIGDSPTDLECLLAADLGICMRDQDGKGDSGGGKLEEALANCEVACIRLRDLGEALGNGEVPRFIRMRGSGEDNGGAEGKFVAWVRNFEEVNAWVDDGCRGLRC